jgi:hypothetical protein
MKKIIVMCLLIPFSIIAQKYQVLSLENNRLKLDTRSSIKPGDVTIKFKNSHDYMMKITNFIDVLGIEKMEVFEKNKDSIIRKYEELLSMAGWADSSIKYEYFKETVFDPDRSYVKFYNSGISSCNCVPDGSPISEGIHIVEIYCKNIFIESFYLLVDKNKLKRYEIQSGY